MFIHEAIKEAVDKKASIRRSEWAVFEWALMPTEPITGVSKHKSFCWNPTPDDLMADDWEVVE